MSRCLPTIRERTHEISSSIQCETERPPDNVEEVYPGRPNDIPRLRTMNRHEDSEVYGDRSVDRSPTTPSSCAPTLHTDIYDDEATYPAHGEQSTQHCTKRSLATPSFGRTPSVHESEKYQGAVEAEKRLKESQHQVDGGESRDRASHFEENVHVIHWRGILAMIAGVFAQMLCWGLIMTYGTILAFYVSYLIPDVSETLVALAGGIPPFCLLALALPWGRLLDAGHHRELNIAAGIFLTTGLTALAFTGKNEYNSGKYWAILLASIPMGIGQSIYFLAAPQMAKTWHPKHKGFAMGVTNSGAAIGGVTWPLVFVRLVDKVGFREGVAVLAGIAALLSIYIAIFAVPAPDFKRRSIGSAAQLRTWWPTTAFKSKVFTIHVISMACVYLGILTIPFFVELWARRSKDIGVSEDTISGNGVDIDSSTELDMYLLITLNACQLPGRLFGSALCDKFKARKIHALACFAAVIIVGSCWFEVSSFEGGETFAAFFGLVLGIMVSLPINDVQDLLGNERTHLMGQYAGVVYTCCCPFILGGAVISGVLVRFFDAWVAPGVWCMVCFGLGGSGILIGLWMGDDTACFELKIPKSSETSTVSEHGGSTRRNSVDAGISHSHEEDN